MSLDFSERIRAYAIQIEDDSEHVTFAELEQMIDSMPDASVTDRDERARRIPSQWPRWAATFAAALVLVIMAIGLPLFFLGGDGAVVEEPTSTTVQSAPTTMPIAPAPSTTVPVIVESWQRVGADAMNDAVGLWDMTLTESGLLAVGYDPGDDMRQNGVVFVSENGVDWVQVAEDDPALRLGAVLMYGVTEGGPGVVAVGMGCEDDIDPCLAYPTVWTSVDGSVWDRTAADAEAFGESGAMLDVIMTDLGVIAVGNVGESISDGSSVSLPAVWLSADGSDWSTVWTGEAIESGVSIGLPGFVSIAEGADGLLVGVGGGADGPSGSVGAVWVSVDGVAWARIDAPSGVFGSGTVIQDVTWGTSGFVAVGTEEGLEPAVWQSPDGYTWTRVDLTGQPFDTTGTIATIAALDDGYVAAGPHPFSDQSGGRATLWTSPNGVRWDRVQTLDEGGAMAVLAIDTGIAVAGIIAGADNFHASVWTGPLPDPNAPLPDPNPPPPSEPADEEVIGALEEGTSCKAIAELTFGYAEAVSYWLRYELADGFDLDADGPPCAEAYDTVDVAAVFGEPDALAVHFVADLSTAAFAATGPAVDAGLMCPTGTQSFVENPATSHPVLWAWADEYTCDDGSGTFVLSVDEYIDDAAGAYGVWKIASGTGAYETLQGGGGTVTAYVETYDASIGRIWDETDDI